MQRTSNSTYIYGTHAVSAALENLRRHHKQLYALPELAENYKAYGKILKVVAKKDIEKLVPKDAVHQGVILETSLLPNVYLEDLPLESERCLLLAFDQVTDPHNVGAILRSAACFNIQGAIHTDRNSPPEGGVLAKAACGALDYVPFAQVTNLARALDTLKEKGFWIVGLSEQGTTFLHTVDMPPKIVLVVGAEGAGMRRLIMGKCDFLVKLPTNPAFPTLNASNAAAIALYEIQQRLGR